MGCQHEVNPLVTFFTKSSYVEQKGSCIKFKDEEDRYMYILVYAVCLSSQGAPSMIPWTKTKNSKELNNTTIIILYYCEKWKISLHAYVENFVVNLSIYAR